MAATSAFDVKLRNIGLMVPDQGYDVTIVCCSDTAQATFWQDRLEKGKGTVVPSSSCVLAVDEDWPGGAGNFLGTLYAWQKACAKRKEQGGDLAAELAAGSSVAIFHTAGKGTRLAPLPGAENNNKPGVKLPGPGAPSILECVIRQTGAYASSRSGRLSVFWGDQIFVPSLAAEYQPRHHADIICALGPMPGADEWAERGLHKYGLIAARDDRSVAIMLEKVTHEQATAQLATLDGVQSVGTSLGSFSLSAALLSVLEKGFATELGAKCGKMDSDPHLWMALTLDADAYTLLMVQKDILDEQSARAHHARVTTIITDFMAAAGDEFGVFGAVASGQDMSWWDYGQLKLYAENSLLLTEASKDAVLARAFFGIAEDSRASVACSLGKCEVDAASVVSTSRFGSGKISNSAVVGVAAGEVVADGAVLVNSAATKIVAAKGAVLYNVVDKSDEGIVLGENEVRVGVFTLDEARPYFEMKSNRAEFDGGKVFKQQICGNQFSFQEVYDLNSSADVVACAEVAIKARSQRADECCGTAA